MKTFKYFFFLLLMTTIYIPAHAQTNLMDISGTWSFSLDSLDVGVKEKWFLKELPEQIDLPGTTDLAGKGIRNTLEPKLEKPQILHLTRNYSYVGAAWYSRKIEIPKSWANKPISLLLERVLWQSRLWIDGVERGGFQESLSTPHHYRLPEGLSAGSHTLTLRIDNRKRYDISVNDMAHAYTNETQIIWNGVLGRMELNRENDIHIERIDLYPDIKAKSVKVNLCVLNNGKKVLSSKLKMEALSLKDGKVLPSRIIRMEIKGGLQNITLEYPMGENPFLWSEFTPDLYEMRVTLKAGRSSEADTTAFGMREISNDHAFIQINGDRVFLRGTLECCVFPLTGTPPTDKKDWVKVFSAAKEWGLNHLRFHSWCPPEAAFEVADEMGFYLQIELPLWSLNVGKEEATNKFLYDEFDRIVAAYGNHPSFCLMSVGNELQPDFGFLEGMVRHMKSMDGRHLYTTTTFTFEKGYGTKPDPEDEFFVSQWTDKGWLRGQGIFDNETPRFDKDYSVAAAGIPVPLISHEIGQYAVFPRLKEIEKYKGVLNPLNFKAVAADLERKGLLFKADDFTKASGGLAVELYKEEIERAMKTPEYSGFQLLGLYDFPGQGTALVGLLDAFWDSKGLTDAGFFRQFCSPVTPLLRFPKAVYTNDEIFRGTLEMANFSNVSFTGKSVTWTLSDDNGKQVESGKINIPVIEKGKTTKLGDVQINLSSVQKAKKLTLTVFLDGTTYKNSWPVWVYPKNLPLDKKQVVLTQDLKKAMASLKLGKTVLLSPRYEIIRGLEGKFLPVFWSPVHFPKQAGTMGLLCNPQHPALADFPTEMHSDWQWWNILKKSKVLVADSISPVTPIVEQVDNFANNRRLVSIFEAKCLSGKLLFSAMDLFTDSETKPEVRQLLFSLLNYMNSTGFNPQKEIPEADLKYLILNQEEVKKADAKSIYAN